jgi:hypothetical protein
VNGYTLFEDENGPFWWKDCVTPGCGNQVCTWLSNSYCHPCACGRAAADAKARVSCASRCAETLKLSTENGLHRNTSTNIDLDDGLKNKEKRVCSLSCGVG